MGIFKTIIKTAKLIKTSTNACCTQLEESLDELQISLLESRKKQKIESEEKYKALFEKYTKKELYTAGYYIGEYFNGDIFKEELEKMQEQHALVVKEAIIKVEAGEMSYKDFFAIALRRNNNG